MEAEDSSVRFRWMYRSRMHLFTVLLKTRVQHVSRKASAYEKINSCCASTHNAYKLLLRAILRIEVLCVSKHFKPWVFLIRISNFICIL